MRRPPEGWPRLSASVFYDDSASAIEWLCKAFQFEVRLRVDGEDGAVVHSELVYGEAVVMVGDAKRDDFASSPRSVGGVNTGALMLYVDDVDAHAARAKEAGAVVETAPETHDYGEEYWVDRSYLAKDPEGHRWYFCQRMRG